MNKDYTFITELNDDDNNNSQLQMLKKYLDESDDEEGNVQENKPFLNLSKDKWQHVYSISILVLLCVIIYFLWKVRKDLSGFSEEI